MRRDEAWKTTLATLTQKLDGGNQSSKVADLEQGNTSPKTQKATMKELKEIISLVPTFESPSVQTTWDDYIAQFETYMHNHEVKRESWTKLLYTRLRGRAAKTATQLDHKTVKYDDYVNAIPRVHRSLGSSRGRDSV